MPDLSSVQTAPIQGQDVILEISPVSNGLNEETGLLIIARNKTPDHHINAAASQPLTNS